MVLGGSQLSSGMGSGANQAGGAAAGKITKAISNVSNTSNASDTKSKDGNNDVADAGKGNSSNSLLTADHSGSRLKAALNGLSPTLFGTSLPGGMFAANRFSNPYGGLFPSGFGGGGGANDAWGKSVASASSDGSRGTTNERGYGGYVGYTPLGAVDLSKIDPDGTKFKAMMAAIKVEEVGVATFNGGTAAGREVTDQRKEDLVKNFLSMYGNDNNFMQRIQTNGFKIVLADQINGSTYVGGGVAGYYDPSNRSATFSKGSLDRYTLGHEMAHARDHIVDGQLDGIYNDVPGFRDALQATIGRISRGEGMNLSRIGYGYENYTKNNDGGVEVLATTAENYFNNNPEFRKVFPEMAKAYDQAFGHVFSNLDGNIRRPLPESAKNTAPELVRQPTEPKAKEQTTTSIDQPKQEADPEKATPIVAANDDSDKKKAEQKSPTEKLTVEIS